MKRKNKYSVCLFLVLLVMLIMSSSDVNAASIYDGLECKNGSLYETATGMYKGSCVTRSDGSFEACPTSKVSGKYDLSKIYSSIEYQYDANSNTYTAVISNLKGLYITVSYMNGTYPSGRAVTPDSSGKVRITGLKLGTQLQFYVFIDKTNVECVDTRLGILATNVPPYKQNVLYNNALCVNYRNKFKSYSTEASKFVPECYNENVSAQYNYNEVKAKVDEATRILNSMISFNGGAGDVDLTCDFFSSNNKGSGEKYTKVISINSYWELVCSETLSIRYDTPKALYAGDSFDYKVNLTVKKKCYIRHTGAFPEPSGSSCESSGPGSSSDDDTVTSASYPDSCKFETECVVWNDDGSTTLAKHAGPSNNFDNCVKGCDGGKYTQACIDSCYSVLNRDGKTASSNKMYNGISSNSLIRKTLGTSNEEILSSGLPYYVLNGKYYYTTGFEATSFDELECDETRTIAAGCYLKTGNWNNPQDSSSCTNDKATYCYEDGGGKGSKYCWMPETKYCKGPNSTEYIEINSGCSGNTTCTEVLQNSSCLSNYNPGNSGSSGSNNNDNTCDDDDCVDCEAYGSAVLAELETKLKEAYSKIESRKYYAYDDDDTSFSASIIDSLTGNKTVYTDKNGNPLKVTSSESSVDVDTTNKEITYEWECEECDECPEEDDDDDDDSGSSHGGGSGPGSDSGGGSSSNDGCSGPGCSSCYIDRNPNAVKLGSENVIKLSGMCDEDLDCECGSSPSPRSDSQTYSLKTYTTSISYTISLGKAYKSAVDGSTIYGANVYNKLDSTVKPQYYYADNKYYTNVYSPMINDWRKWPTYEKNYNSKVSCLTNGTCINKNDSSIKHNILEYIEVGSWGQWTINLECFYGIINNYCVGCSNGDKTIEPDKPVGCDSTKDVCTGGLTYMFRQIDLDFKNMFPDRAPRWNWTGTISTNSSGKTVVSGAASNKDIKYIVDPAKLISSIQNKGSKKVYGVPKEGTEEDSYDDLNNPELDYEILLTKNNIRNIKLDLANGYSSSTTCKGSECVKNKFDMSCKMSSNYRVICTSKFLTNTRYLTLVKKPTDIGCNNLYGGRCSNNF